MRFFIELAYNGKAYHGWQIQPNAVTIQEVIEKALSTLLSDKISVVGAGRTDTGVHASQMFAHFDYNESIDNDQLTYKLNSLLPSDISVLNLIEVDPDAHARFDAISRTYNYRICTTKDVFEYDFSYAMHLPLDIKKMNDAADVLLMYSDFQCFSKSNTDVKTYNCNIKEAIWSQQGNMITFVITADRFLRNMVRAIVGTLIEIGLHKRDIDDLREIIKSKNRSNAGYSVPAHGLFLTRIEYPQSIMKTK
ncbi:MAG: tRNA pseudouridine(38-40) synthase TruA [Winogradskyella sp.]|nr:tRNA pseudouridine(38-40) synthase TruA [Winogradskyella sp.]